MTAVLPPNASQSSFEPIHSATADPIYELSEKHYGDCNVRPYFVKIGLCQEALRDKKLMENKVELQRLRGQLDTITSFLTEVQAQKDKKHVDFTGKNQLMDDLYKILPDDRLKQSKLSKTDAEILCLAMTRKSENHITPDIEDLTNDMTHIIEDLDKILPILKELMKSYDDLINRINNKQK